MLGSNLHKERIKVRMELFKKKPKNYVQIPIFYKMIFFL